MMQGAVFYSLGQGGNVKAEGRRNRSKETLLSPSGGGLNADRVECRPPLRAECRPGLMPTGWMPTADSPYRAECRLQTSARMKPN